MPPIRNVEETLRIICKTLITFFLSRFGQDMFRVCVGRGAALSPELGRSFYDSGPRKWGRKIAQYLDSPRRARRAPRSRTARSPRTSSRSFAAPTSCSRLLFGIEKDPPEAEIDRVAEEAVKTFLARYRRV